MKKLLLIIYILSAILNINSQIVQEQIITQSKISTSGFVRLENSGIKYFITDRDNYNIKMYNLDHSVFKNIQLDPAIMGLTNYPENEFIFYPYALSENLFDSDDDVEFLLYIYSFSSDFQSHIEKTFIFNDDGSILFERSNQSPADIYQEEMVQFPNWMQNTPNGAKMLLVTSDGNNNDSLIVYGLPGSIPCYSCDNNPNYVSENEKSLNDLYNYPNPAKNYTVIKYELPAGEKEAEIQIYQLNGQLIKSYSVDTNFDSLLISTDEFASGTYLYKIITRNGISKSNKLIISN